MARTESDRILVFIPCYNCAPQIGRVLQQIRGEVASFVEEVLVLDNGSTDGTVEEAIKHSADVPVAKVTVGRNRENYNLGGSHKAAFTYAAQHGFTHVVILHGDDQGNIVDLLPTLRAGIHRQFDACLGARFMRGSKLENYSAFRIAGNYVFNGIYSLAARQRLVDMGSGLNILSAKVFSDERLKRLPDDLYFNAYLLLEMADQRRSLSFFPISWREDDQVSNVKLVSQSLQMLRAPLLYTFRRGMFRSSDFRRQPRAEYAFEVVTAPAGQKPKRTRRKAASL